MPDELESSKTSLTLVISRMKLLQIKRDLLLKRMRKEIAQFLRAGQEAIARIRVKHVIREQNIMAAYYILELFCEFVHARIPIIDSQKYADLLLDVPKLLQLKNLFITKYGKEFISAVYELRSESGVNQELIEKLSVSAPPAKVRLMILKDIAQEHALDLDSSNTEAELRCFRANYTQLQKQYPPANFSVPVEKTDIASHYFPATSDARHPSPEANINVSVENAIIETSSQENNGRRRIGDGKIEAKAQSSDISKKARAAIAATERASAAARAAAELAIVNRVQI